MMLEGVRILEIEGLGPAPFASMLLADLGADVIIVHRPVASGVPGMPDRPVIDRGKRSIALNLKDAQDLSTFKQLVESADALMEGFRPGVMERLGIGPDECLALNPRLVFGRMTGWGQNNDMSMMAGHDLNYVSLSGAAWYSSEPNTTPQPPPTLVGDIGGGALYLVVGLLAGIINAKSSGKGTVVDAAIVDGSAHMMNLLMTLRQGGGMVTQRGQSLLDGSHFSRCYLTKDKHYVSVQCLEPAFYSVFLSKLGLSDDPAFSQQFEKSHWPTQTVRLQSIFETKTRNEWEALFAGSDACVAPVLSPEEAKDHPVLQERGVWMEKQGVLQSAAAPRFSTGNSWEHKPSPKRDEHKQDILDELVNKTNGKKD